MLTRAYSQPMPKYYLVRSILLARLQRDGVPGERLPAEVNLCREFGTSRITVQQALRLLEKEGVIRRERGRGTFYIGEPPAVEAKLSGILDSVMQFREGARAQVLGKKLMAATPRLARRLQIPIDAPIWSIDRVAVLDDHPVLFTTAFIPREIGELLIDDEELTVRTVASILQDKHGIELTSVQQTIAATLADPAFAAPLGVDVGAPVLEVERVYLGTDGKPVNFSITFYRTDRYRLEIATKEWR
jgi:GntR family transcriptional regulator